MDADDAPKSRVVFQPGGPELRVDEDKDGVFTWRVRLTPDALDAIRAIVREEIAAMVEAELRVRHR